jgi:hypothetical protein
MTDDEARLRRAKQAGRNAVRSGPDVFHARLTRQLAKLDRTRSATPEAARGRPGARRTGSLAAHCRGRARDNRGHDRRRGRRASNPKSLCRCAPAPIQMCDGNQNFGVSRAFAGGRMFRLRRLQLKDAPEKSGL